MFQSFICLPFFLLLRIERKRILHPPDLILQLRFPALIGCGSFPAPSLHLPSKCFQTALFFQYPFFLFHKLQMVLSGGKLLDCILFQSPRLFLEPPAFLRQLMQKCKQFRSICPVPLFQRLPSFFPLRSYRLLRPGNRHLPDDFLAPGLVILQLSIQRPICLPQLLLDSTVDPGMENARKYLFSFFGGCMKQTDVFALRDHRDLRKLIAVHAHDRPDLLIDLTDPAGHLTSIRQKQRRFRRHTRRRVCAVLIFPLTEARVCRTAADRIILPLILKRQFHPGFRVLRCILAAKHRAFSPGTARRPVERKRDRVKDRRFACPRIARDQEQTRPRPFEINLRHAPIRAKRRHCKQLRFHTRSSSSASSTMRARIVSCSSVIGQWRTAS